MRPARQGHTFPPSGIYLLKGSRMEGKAQMVTRSLALTVAALVCANAQDVSSIQQRLEAQYALTKTTFDQSDIVTQGSVLTLKIDKIVMVPVNGNTLSPPTSIRSPIATSTSNSFMHWLLPPSSC